MRPPAMTAATGERAAPVIDLRVCNGCGMSRRVRLYRHHWWLCIDGPNKCYRHRRRIVAILADLRRKG